MAITFIKDLFRRLYKVSPGEDASEPTDRELLERFLARRDEEAFAVLIERHGPMVLGVCCRILGRAEDAEAAFQATFLVLVRKAASLAARDLLANWLYRVAHRTALKARAMIAKRQWRERQGTAVPEPGVVPPDTQEVEPILDEELARLPDKYRMPIILCELEGKSHQEAAQQLRWPVGTLSGRLSRARKLLSDRLTRRGVALSASALAVVLSQKAAASVPVPVAAA